MLHKFARFGPIKIRSEFSFLCLRKLSTDKVDEERKLYTGPNSDNYIAKAIFASTAINAIYWAHSISNHVLYKDKVIHGIGLGSHMPSNYIGLFCTGIMCYGLHTYTSSVARTVSLSPCGTQLELEFNGLLGSIGKNFSY